VIPEEYEETGIPVDAELYAEHCVLAERERCAKIADRYADDPHGSNPSCATGETIAAEIRKGA
jgi:hypothetical protein